MEDFKKITHKLVEEQKWQELLELADNALAKLNNNSKNYDELAQIYYAKAQALYFCEDLEQAKLYLNKILELEPSEYTIKAYAACAYIKLVHDENYEETIKYCDKVIELKPDINYYEWRGCAKGNLNLLDEAIKDFDKIIELDPNNANAYFFRGNAKANLTCHRSAILDFNKAIELGLNEISVYCNRAMALLNEKDFEKALNDITYAIELNPQDGQLLELLIPIFPDAFECPIDLFVGEKLIPLGEGLMIKHLANRDLYKSTTTKTYPYMRIRDKSSLGKYEYEICILTQQVLKKDIANKNDEINIILNDINNVIEKYSLISVQNLSKIIINKIISYYKLNEKNT